MAALSFKFLKFPIFISVIYLLQIFSAGGERHGLPARYISMASQRATRGPLVINSDVSNLGDIGTPSQHSRKRRDTSEKSQSSPTEPEISIFSLNDTHRQVLIDWAGEGSKVVVCVTRDTIQNASSNSNILISNDYGKTYTEVKDKFMTSAKKPAIINKFYKNDKFTSRFVFTDVINKYVYVTRDYGGTVVAHKVMFTPSEVTHHPINADVLLVYDTEDTERKLRVSEDFGEEWRVIGRYVKSYYWSEMTEPPTLYIEREELFGSASVVSSQDLFSEDSTPTTVIMGVEDFEVKDEFLFAIKKVHLLGTPSKEPELQLWVSYSGGPFLRAKFPNNLEHQHYYVANISEGQIMVCVAHDQVVSNLYVSSVPRSGNHQVLFSLSLERILYFNPTVNWEDTWLSDVTDKAFADLYPVEGVRGVFIASQLMTNYSKSTSTLGPEHLTSYITFDQGGQWKPLQPPRRDADGREINCKRSDGCSLHVSQELSQLYPASHTMSLLSKRSAPGLIMATGTIGTSLKGHTSLYLSTDAGINWFQVLKGNYLYTFGDHGGIIMAVQLYQADGETNEIQFSIDEGNSWHTIPFHNESLRIYGMMTEPGETTTVFTLFGSRSTKHQWIFIKVDMKSVFRGKCTREDYKTWSPSDGRSGRMCLLGRREVYERRVRESNCFNGENYDRPISVENCPCDREDFECDYGFIDNMESQKCLVDPNLSSDVYGVPKTCTPGHYYNRTKGYRKVPGDTCEGGREYQYLPSIIACPVSEEQEFLLVSARQKILRYDLLNPEAGLETLPIPNLKMVIALDFNLKNDCIFWSDVEEKKIMRLCFDGQHGIETLVDTDLSSVEGLAYDWIANHLYFVDGDKKSLQVIRTDINNFGRMRRTLLDDDTLDNPRGIAVHPARGYLYLTDWSEKSPMVARTFLDGSKLQVLFGVDKVGWPNGVTVDFQTDRIFFADAKLDYIASADLDGKHMRKIITDSDKVMQPFAVAVYKSTLFWDDWTVHHVLQADKEFGWGISPITNTTRTGLVDLKVYGHWSQQGSNVCGTKVNVNCSHMCMALPENKHVCLCPDGLKEGPNGTCLCPDNSPVEADGTCKSVGSTCGPNYFMCNNSRCIPENWVCDSDNDCEDNSDEMQSPCLKQTCDPPSWQCGNGHCIAPSWRCDRDNDCGDNSDEQGCSYGDCPQQTFKCANQRCIHSNWVCDMEDDCRDGSDELHCNTTESQAQCRAFQFKCVSDGRCLPESWHCDGDNDCDDKSDENECDMYSCKTWQFSCKSNQCIFRSWQCDGEPDCDDGSDELDCANVTTTPPPIEPDTSFFPPGNANCTALMFRCQNSHCIPFWWRCDGLDDCGDSSDENGCARPFSNATTVVPTVPPSLTHTCSGNQFQCNNTFCIWEAWVCDGDKDCQGGEDEENCHQTENCAALEEFKCRHSGGCIMSNRICNGHMDCADGSDEEGCDDATPAPVSDCPNGYFMCDGGTCQESFKLCDGNHDCVDLTDEQHCSSDTDKAYSVNTFTNIVETNTSVSVDWTVSDTTGNTTVPANLEYLPSLIKKAALGNPSAWRNITWTTNTSYKFLDLDPFTYYVLKVYIRKANESKIFPPVKSVVFHTQEGVPSPPTDVKVDQVGSTLKVSWADPDHPNGVIKSYHVFVTPPAVPREEIVPAVIHEITLPRSLTSNSSTIWVTAQNEDYMSEPSQKVVFVQQNIDSPLKVRVVNKSSSAVRLSWDAVEGVDGYIVSHTQPENNLLLGKIYQNTTNNSVEMTNLAPEVHYVFDVQAFKANIVGPTSSVEDKIEGQPLVPVTNLNAHVMKDVATTVKLSWQEPRYKVQNKAQQIKWQYRLLWGKSASDLKHAVNRASTANTSFVIRGLEACETYFVAVMVEAPIGIGPVAQKKVSTGSDPLAPPKNVEAKLADSFNKTMTITWEPACPRANESGLAYLLSIRDVNFNQTSYYSFPMKIHSHTVESHWGGRYSITLRTSRSESRQSKPAFCSGPVIPPPYDLTHNPSDDSFFWKKNVRLPLEIYTRNITYVLYLSRNRNMSNANTYSTSAPPLVVNDLSPGVIYYATVALKDADGYLSPQSQSISIEKPIADEIVLSQGSVVGAAVSVILVVLALVVVVGILAVRHRRLARSFLTFANTHYDRSQGTTVITTDHNLDEDDDSPMIRGFSDDEPLVIA